MDVRWKQRFDQYRKALQNLEDAVNLFEQREAEGSLLSIFEEAGLIQFYEFTFELAWKTLQDYLIEIGYTEIRGPNPVLEQALNLNLLHDRLLWRNMKDARNKASHTYDSQQARTIAQDVVKHYLEGFRQLTLKLETLC